VLVQQVHLGGAAPPLHQGQQQHACVVARGDIGQ
jgi:hypothetical protein